MVIIPGRGDTGCKVVGGARPGLTSNDTILNIMGNIMRCVVITVYYCAL